jgi:hypothetical protein
MAVNIHKFNLMFTVVTNQEALNIIIFTSIDGMEVDIPKFNLMFTDNLYVNIRNKSRYPQV